ncbi:hypothetical protein MCOR27_001004 [Pyricularia oryzae]|uniref:O-methyltransferase C-terminal domain-containing protein n=2 Tax=Pyricularia TaxID=48558 RepID=A0ABQ8NZQ4_PYRGI|nr:hypothetical protein MCOR01_003412 [Pyricularia oryzae]KAI6304427.1 hypothetical protein MCOR33_000521 [Pyricularia grisea]KAH9432282.1 hypothetical protein MCOR02_006985 [Pyricularia oryzae]KAI6261422.1 hypothetical protein MCOR19_002329 [Pyricularia oryzae]KAI6281962.1 hypothetical protein MCOR26_003089 [Pyricularia oryzae]
MAAETLTKDILSALSSADALAALRSDDEKRHSLQAAAAKLSLALESQGDTVNRVRQTPLQLAMAKVGVDKKIFEILAQAKRDNQPLSHAELAAKTGVEPAMMKRILRYWGSMGTITQVEVDKYTANNVTEALASAQGRTAITHGFNFKAPVFLAIPPFFERHGYKLITDINDTPFQMAHNTKLDPWTWGKERPERYQDFLGWMEHARDGDPSFLDSVDLGGFFENSHKDTLLFVDVSGSRGYVTTAVRERYTNVPGRVVLQDQPHIVDLVKKDVRPELKTIELQGHDFFTGATPLKGARVYYLRNILHDWSDAKSLEILASVTPSMDKDSVMLLDEVVLPEMNPPWRGTQLDVEMLTHLAGAERTENDWRGLLDAAGLKVDKITPYFSVRGDSVIQARLK